MAIHEQKMGMLAEQARDAVEEFCTPDKMTKPEAKDFLELVISNLQTSIEALGEEMQNEEAG